MPTVHLTRDSVAAGDDADAPHSLSLNVTTAVAAADDLKQVIHEVRAAGYLPSVAGSASWAAFSNMPLAVISNERAEPSFFWILDSELAKLAWHNGELRLHFAYMATTLPEAVFDILNRCMSAWRN